MGRPKLLDLFCGAGGASMGYYLAGFDVTGVDINPQPRYFFDFIQADALRFPLGGFDVVHASPPCKTHTRMKHLREAQNTEPTYPDLIASTRDHLVSSGTIWVIENVPGAPLKDPIVLCGSSFALRVRRHRLFESNVTIRGKKCRHSWQGRPVGVWNWGKWGHEIPNGGKSAASLEDAHDAMGFPSGWMNRKEIAESIPLAYTEWIGKQILKKLGSP